MNEYIGIIDILGNWEFEDILLKDEYASWTREQAEVIFEHMEERAQHEGGHIELDLASIRGAYTAFESLEDVALEYGFKPDDVEDIVDHLAYDMVEVIEGEDVVLVFNPY